MEINLTFTAEEVNQILMGLSSLPTSTGVYPLAMRIKAEAEKQLAANQAAREAQ
jgi:hypothetical protein